MSVAPSFNPVGTLIAYEGDGPGGGPRDIWTCLPDGTNPQHITETSLWESNPSFNSDGSKNCFSKEMQQGVFVIYSMNPDGTSAEQISFPDPDQDDFSGIYGLNDEYLIIWRRMGASPDFDEIGKYIISTGEFIQLTDDDAMDQYPDWNPHD
jgi:Tol biopolymer transport system component